MPRPLGHGHGTFGVVDLDRPLNCALGLARLAGEVENMGEILVRAPSRGRHVGRVRELAGLACKPFGLSEATAPRENFRLHSPRENLGIGVVACAELQAAACRLEGGVEVPELVEGLALNAKGARQPGPFTRLLEHLATAL